MIIKMIRKKRDMITKMIRKKIIQIERMKKATSMGGMGVHPSEGEFRSMVNTSGLYLVYHPDMK